jgi:hypothetical protein
MRANIEEHRSILLKKIEELQNELKEAQQKLMSYEVEWNQQYPFLEHLESLEKEKILVHRLHSGSLFIGKGVNSFDSVFRVISDGTVLWVPKLGLNPVYPCTPEVSERVKTLLKRSR